MMADPKDDEGYDHYTAVDLPEDDVECSEGQDDETSDVEDRRPIGI